MARLSDNDKNLLKTSAKVVTDAGVQHVEDLLKVTPLLGLAYELAKGLIGNSMELRKQRVFEFMEPIVQNPSLFTKQILSSDEFQDGFATTLHQYITMRTERKRRVVRAAFEDFARSLDKPNFQLERFTDTIQKISPSSIALLSFINNTLLPYRDEQIRKELATQNLGTEKPYEWWFELTKKREPISKYLDQWLFDRYNPAGTDIKDKYGVTEAKDIPEKEQFRLMEIETAQREKYHASFGELTYLGIFGSGFRSATWGDGGGITWTLTDFGYEFIQYIEETDEDRQLLESKR